MAFCGGQGWAQCTSSSSGCPPTASMDCCLADGFAMDKCCRGFSTDSRCMSGCPVPNANPPHANPYNIGTQHCCPDGTVRLLGTDCSTCPDGQAQCGSLCCATGCDPQRPDACNYCTVASMNTIYSCCLVGGATDCCQRFPNEPSCPSSSSGISCYGCAVAVNAYNCRPDNSKCPSRGNGTGTDSGVCVMTNPQMGMCGFLTEGN